MAGNTLQDIVSSLFERHHTAIFAYLYRLVGDCEAAYDLTRETFVKVYEKRHRLASVDQVADALGISQGAVKTRLYRAREMFRRAYTAEVAP